MALTLVSAVVGISQRVDGASILGGLVLVIAFAKMWLVGMDFMELRGAPPALRRAFEAYLVLVLVALVGIYWAF